MLILRSLGRFNSATICFSRAIGRWMATRPIYLPYNGFRKWFFEFENDGFLDRRTIYGALG
jgi:hypothetical protein